MLFFSCSLLVRLQDYLEAEDQLDTVVMVGPNSEVSRRSASRFLW